MSIIQIRSTTYNLYYTQYLLHLIIYGNLYVANFNEFYI